MDRARQNALRAPVSSADVAEFVLRMAQDAADVLQGLVAPLTATEPALVGS